jgi:hypothetical protein
MTFFSVAEKGKPERTHPTSLAQTGQSSVVWSTLRGLSLTQLAGVLFPPDPTIKKSLRDVAAPIHASQSVPALQTGTARGTTRLLLLPFHWRGRATKGESGQTRHGFQSRVTRIFPLNPSMTTPHGLPISFHQSRYPKSC